MLNVIEYYKSESNYLKAEDIPPGKQVQLTISGLEEVKFDSGNKLALSFAKTEKKLVLNKTNSTRIAEVLGPDAETWMGKDIFVHATTTEYQGKPTPCIRVEMPRETVAFQPQQAPAQAAQQAAPAQEIQQNQTQAPAQTEPPPNYDNFDNSVPF